MNKPLAKISSIEVLTDAPVRSTKEIITFREGKQEEGHPPSLKRTTSFHKLVILNNKRLSRPKKKLGVIERVQATILLVSHYAEEKLASNKISPPLTRRNSSPNMKRK